jgi:hypothetical protein
MGKKIPSLKKMMNRDIIKNYRAVIDCEVNLAHLLKRVLTAIFARLLSAPRG